MGLPNVLEIFAAALNHTSTDANDIGGTEFDPAMHQIIDHLTPAEIGLRTLVHAQASLANAYHEMYQRAASGTPEERDAFMMRAQTKARYDIANELLNLSLRDRITVDETQYVGVTILKNGDIAAVKKEEKPATEEPNMPHTLGDLLQALGFGNMVVVGVNVGHGAEGNQPEAARPPKAKMN